MGDKSVSGNACFFPLTTKGAKGDLLTQCGDHRPLSLVMQQIPLYTNKATFLVSIFHSQFIREVQTLTSKGRKSL